MCGLYIFYNEVIETFLFNGTTFFLYINRPAVVRQSPYSCTTVGWLLYMKKQNGCR